MTDAITVTGLVATTPRHLVTSEGLPITSFRLASTQRRYDRGAQKWIDGENAVHRVRQCRLCSAHVHREKFQSTRASTVFSAIITAIHCTTRRPSADFQIPMANRKSSALETVNQRTTNALVGAPIANSSLTAWSR